MHYRPNVISHSITLDFKFRDGLKRGYTTNRRCTFHHENTVIPRWGGDIFICKLMFFKAISCIVPKEMLNLTWSVITVISIISALTILLNLLDDHQSVLEPQFYRLLILRMPVYCILKYIRCSVCTLLEQYAHTSDDISTNGDKTMLYLFIQLLATGQRCILSSSFNHPLYFTAVQSHEQSF